MVFTESGLTFDFDDVLWNVDCWDKSHIHRKCSNYSVGSVDFVGIHSGRVFLIEVKSYVNDDEYAANNEFSRQKWQDILNKVTTKSLWSLSTLLVASRNDRKGFASKIIADFLNANDLCVLFFLEIPFQSDRDKVLIGSLTQKLKSKLEVISNATVLVINREQNDMSKVLPNVQIIEAV